MNKHIIDGLEVLHIPNAFSDDVLRKWEDFYINVPFFNCGGDRDENAKRYFTAGLNLVDYINIFPVNDVIKHARVISPDCKKLSYHASLINAIGSNQIFEPHTDTDKFELGENEFYTVVLWFGNPHWDHVSGGSLVLGDQQDFIIPNRYNDLVIFPGQMLHTMESHTSNLTRVTVYSSFTNQFNNLAAEILAKNCW